MHSNSMNHFSNLINFLRLTSILIAANGITLTNMSTTTRAQRMIALAEHITWPVSLLFLLFGG